MEAKRLQLLHELVPNVSVVAIVVNPNNPQADDQLQELQNVSHALGVQVEPFKASTPSEIDRAFANLMGRGAVATHRVFMRHPLPQHQVGVIEQRQLNRLAESVNVSPRKQRLASALPFGRSSLSFEWRQDVGRPLARVEQVASVGQITELTLTGAHGPKAASMAVQSARPGMTIT